MARRLKWSRSRSKLPPRVPNPHRKVGGDSGERSAVVRNRHSLYARNPAARAKDLAAGGINQLQLVHFVAPIEFPNKGTALKPMGWHGQAMDDNDPFIAAGDEWRSASAVHAEEFATERAPEINVEQFAAECALTS